MINMQFVTRKRMLGKCHESNLRLIKFNLKKKEKKKLMLNVKSLYKYINFKR